MPWRKEVNIPRGCLAQVDTFWGDDYKQETLELVNALNEQHNFLLPKETPEKFCQQFDYGVVAEHYRALFYQKPVWWKEKSCFRSGKRVGLPYCLKPYLYLLCFKLSKTEGEDAYLKAATIYDWRTDC